ncbi:MAG: class I SAM-dependent methyltransferase [Candidatus Aenigmarchaeota archaeon]
MDTGEYNRKFYSNIFNKRADRYYKIQKKKISIVLNLLEKHENGKVLDVGCGDGLISSLIATATGAKVYGVDISSEAVSKARKRGIIAKVMNVDKQGFPFEKESFDAVFCGDLLEHLYDTEKLLENVRQILKPNGYLIISVPNIASWYNRGFLLIGFMPTWIESSLKTYTGNPVIKEGVGHIHAFTKRSLTELLRLKGFSIEKVTGSPILADGSRSKWKESLWNGADSAFAKKDSLASTLIVKASKAEKRNKKGRV